MDPKVSKWTLKDVFKLVGFVSLTSRGVDLRLRRKSSKLLLKRLRLLLSKKSKDLMAQLNLSMAKFAKIWRKIDVMLSQAKNSEEKLIVMQLIMLTMNRLTILSLKINLLTVNTGCC